MQVEQKERKRALAAVGDRSGDCTRYSQVKDCG